MLPSPPCSTRAGGESGCRKSQRALGQTEPRCSLLLLRSQLLSRSQVPRVHAVDGASGIPELEETSLRIPLHSYILWEETEPRAVARRAPRCPEPWPLGLHSLNFITVFLT